MNHTQFSSRLKSSLTVLLIGACLFLQAAAPVSARAQRSESQDRAAALAPPFGDCSIFPANNVWNTPIDDLPLDPSSAQWIASIGGTTHFHMDFGTVWDNAPIGIPYNLADSSTTKFQVTFDESGDESDDVLYPIPDPPLIEGGNNSDGDRHILIVDTSTCTLYELYAAVHRSDGWHAGSGAIWNLNANALRTAGWTSADAAGLPILPGLVRYEEVQSGEIKHAIRFTARRTAGYIWPARHLTSQPQNGIPPMGARFRLKASYNISGFDPRLQVILRAMQTYGIILADNGSNWYISGAPNSDWDDDLLHRLDVLTGNDFEAVDTDGLMVDPDSGATTETFVVTTTSDSGAGSLRQAVADAESGDTIAFAPALAGQTITITNYMPINKSLTIDGSGLSPQVTISGEHIANMDVPVDTTVTISNVTIANSHYGLRGNLTIRNSTLKNNTSDMGGAVSSYGGSLTIENSTLTQNHANYSGGALDINGGTARIVNSTITGNEAVQRGGGIWLSGGAAVEMVNTTFAGNNAPQGSEISINGASSGTLSVSNSLFVCVGTHTSCYDYSPGQVTATNSILDDGTLADFGLSALASNGGPTQTMALLADSPAINTGSDASCPSADQRGVSRPQGSHCDMGAYEYVDTTPPTVLNSGRADPSPTSAASVRFTVSFSERVTGVDANDFGLSATGVAGAAISGVSGSGSSYTVTVDTGMTGPLNGTLRLNVIDDDSIQDAFGNLLGGPGAGNGNFNTGESYLVAAHVPAPTLLFPPGNNYVTRNATPTFTWVDVTDASQYEIQLATNEAFTQEAVSWFPIDAEFPVSSALSAGKYYWHVRAYNILNEYGNWSVPRSFTIDVAGPAAPALTLPANGTSLRGTPTFRWAAVSGAALYQFQLDNDADCSSPLVSVEQRATSRKPAGGLRGTYSWRVRARDAAGNWGPWSPVFTVTILPPR